MMIVKSVPSSLLPWLVNETYSVTETSVNETEND